MKKALLAAVILGATISSAQALEGGYIGFGYNIDNIKYDDPSFDITENAASAISLVAGYNVNRYVGIELRTLIGATGTESGNYVPDCEQDDQPFEVVVDPLTGENASVQVDCPTDAEVSEVKLNAQASVNLKLGLPITQYVTLLGKAGYSYTDYKVEKKYYDSDTTSGKVNKGAGSETVNIYGEGEVYGLGLGFEMKDGSQIEVMYNQNYNDNDLKHSSIQLGYNYSF